MKDWPVKEEKQDCTHVDHNQLDDPLPFRTIQQYVHNIIPSFLGGGGGGGGGDYKSKPPKVESTFVIVITFFSSYLRAGNISSILLHILCAFKLYVECLYRHIFIEDKCTNIKVSKNIYIAPQVWYGHNPHPFMVCESPKPIAVISWMRSMRCCVVEKL